MAVIVTQYEHEHNAGVTLSKGFVYALDTLIALAGAILIAGGIYGLCRNSVNWGHSTMIVAIAVGTILALFSIIGCIGARHRSRRILVPFWIVTFALLIVTIVYGALTTHAHSHISDLRDDGPLFWDTTSGGPHNTLENLRGGFYKTWVNGGCQGGDCTTADCTAFFNVVCTDNSGSQDQFNKWNQEYTLNTTSINDFKICHNNNVASNPPSDGALNSWCRSRRAVINNSRTITLVGLIIFWVAALLLLMQALAVCNIMRSRRRVVQQRVVQQ